MSTLSRRIAVVVLTLGLVAGAWRPCAGWEPTPDARMSCCLKHSACAKHRDGGGERLAVSQAAADACCALSERQTPGQPSSAPVAAPALVPVLAFVQQLPAPAARAIASRRPPPTLDRRQPPRHLLLSVFVI